VVLHGRNTDVAVPQPLTPSDATLLRRAFALQDRGNLQAASHLADEVEDKLLHGHLLADRYLGRFHRSTLAELTEWLDQYGREPDALAIRALLVRRLPKGAATPPMPVIPTAFAAPADNAPPEDVDPEARLVPRNLTLDRTVIERSRRGATQSALRLIASTKGLPPAYAALLRGEVARVLFVANDDAEALHVARMALAEAPTDQRVGLPGFIGGLAAWRLAQVADAHALFAGAADAPLASAGTRAAAAFWAARTAHRLHRPADSTGWLHRAAAERTTLHGLLARRMLGLPTGIIPSSELLTQADVDAIGATGPGLRAFALLQIGQSGRAEAELRLLWPMVQGDPAQRRSLLLVTAALGLTDLAAQFADLAEAADGQPRDDLRFPLPPLRPDGGFRIDPALVYALARLESNFDAGAVSSAGAHGLMQLMPVTARYVADDASLLGERLHDPAVNLALGQRYVIYLAQQPSIGNDLLTLLASYNAGPGSLARWRESVRDDGDPLLFLEAIPNDETRAFVQHALTYIWIYAGRLHVSAPSLDELAAGEWPRFTPPQEGGKIAVAAPRIH